MEPTGIQFAGVFGLGGPEVLVILALALLLFGAKRWAERG